MKISGSGMKVSDQEAEIRERTSSLPDLPDSTQAAQ
jgi:hypothetical protein